MDRPRNIILAGSAGMGKSVTCKSICLNVDASNQNNPDDPTCLIIIDPKTDYSREIIGQASHNEFSAQTFIFKEAFFLGND